VRRFILGMLRKAQAPLTSAQITEAWLTARGLRTDDDTRVVEEADRRGADIAAGRGRREERRGV
jgi:hypothetical protein